jgi:sec-independent protein translocase protein TatC
MTLTEHLRELRQRVIWSAIAIAIGMGISWAYRELLFDWLMEPYAVVMRVRYPELTDYISFRSLIEPFAVYLKTSLLGGVLLAGPVVLLQIWLFVGPGLHAHEKRMALPFLLATIVFFFGGVGFCRYLVLEPAMGVLLDIGETSASPNIMMQEYFSFTTRMLIVFGVLFEMPVVITFLSWLELVTAAFLIRQWRYAVVLTFVLGAMLTPPDPLSQAMLAIPLCVLYLLSVGICRLIELSRARRRRTEPAA